jgi:hypothetical protein
MSVKFRIADAKGDDYYNDTTLYDTLEAAEIELARAKAWVRQEARFEPTWAHADLRIVEVAEGGK